MFGTCLVDSVVDESTTRPNPSDVKYVRIAIGSAVNLVKVGETCND